MRFLIALLLASAQLAWSQPPLAVEGLIQAGSNRSVDATVEGLLTAIESRGLNLFNHLDHAAGAANAGMTLRPTQLLIFGNPQGGTPFMHCAQTVAIDLPLKILVWQDEAGQTRVGYNDPAFLASRHQAGDCPVVETLQGTLAAIVEEALAP